MRDNILFKKVDDDLGIIVPASLRPQIGGLSTRGIFQSQNRGVIKSTGFRILEIKFKRLLEIASRVY